MRLKYYIYLLTAALSLPLSSYADHCGGKVDFGPVYVHLDVLESGHTVKKLDFGGFKLNGTIMIKEGYGFCVKPDVIYATGHDGELLAGSLGFGHVTPINDKFCVTPTVGLTLSNLSTNYNALPPRTPIKLHLRERFRSLAPFIGLDVNYTIIKGLRICGNFQYSWSRTHTKIKTQHTMNDTEIKNKYISKGDSKGPSYALMIEKDLNDKYSIHLGAAYNSSLSHEKHGLRGYGIKLGVARWF